MINGLILSKNRASQLRFLFESISKNTKDFFNEIVVIYTSTNEDYAKGYEKLKQENILPNVVWVEEKDFVSDFLHYLKTCESEYICGIVDDCVFYRQVPVNAEKIKEFMSDDVFCFSLRLGINTTMQNYLQPDLYVPIKNYQQNPYCIKWNWKEWSAKLNFGYPISLDGHIFRTKELSDLSHSFEFEYLRQWEGVLAGECREKTDKDSMLAFRQNVLFSIPSNCVQDPPLTAGEVHGFSEKILNEKYLNNEVIDFDQMQYAFQNVEWSHNEVHLLFKSI